MLPSFERKPTMTCTLGKPAGFGVHPLTSRRWPDFETLFGAHGAYGGCWCRWIMRCRLN